MNKICNVCNIEFKQKPGSTGTYCSHACSNIGRKGKPIYNSKHYERIEKELAYNLKPDQCLCCNKKITFVQSVIHKNKFCSRSCSARVTNKHYPKRVKAYKHCQGCNKKLDSNRKFCTAECKQSFIWINDRIPKILLGQISTTSTLKKFVVERDTHICSHCNIKDIWNNKLIVLQLDHIDGDSDNNLPNNLRLLCPNCHSQTTTWGMKGRSKNDPTKITRRNTNLRKYQEIVK